MKARALLAAALGAALVAGGASCVTYRGPRGVEEAIEREIGADLDREFGLKLGWTSTRVVAALVRDGAEDDPLDLGGLTGLGVAVFGVPEGARPPRRIDGRRLGLRGWETVLDVRDEGEQVLLLARGRGGEIRDALVVAYDGEEVVLARLRGRLDRIVDRMLEGAEADGARGARRAASLPGA